VYSDQSTTSASAGAAAAAVIEVKVEAFYESEEALRAETRTSICALRPSQGQHGIGIGVFVSGFARCSPIPMRRCVYDMAMPLSVAGITYRLLLSLDTSKVR
jgi:hypothetical protein